MSVRKAIPEQHVLYFITSLSPRGVPHENGSKGGDSSEMVRAYTNQGCGFNAVHVENLLRAQWSLPLRTHYGIESMLKSGTGALGFYRYGIRTNHCYNCTPPPQFYTGPNSGR